MLSPTRLWSMSFLLLFLGPFVLGVSPQGLHTPRPKPSARAHAPLTEMPVNPAPSYIVPGLPTGFPLEIDADTDPDCAVTTNCDWDDLEEVTEKLAFISDIHPHFQGYFAISHSDDRLYVYVNIDDTDDDPNSADNLVLMLDTNHDHVANDEGVQVFRNGTVKSVTDDPTDPTPGTPLFSSGQTAWPACQVRICIRSFGSSWWRLEGWLEPADFGLSTFSGAPGAVVVAEDAETALGTHNLCDGSEADSDRSCWPENTDPAYWNHLRLDPPELVLLFDVSGSMSWSPEGVPGVQEDQQRLRRAKNASKPFIQNMNAQYEGGAKFGIAAFPIDSWTPGAPCNGQIKTTMTTVDNNTANVATSTTIENLTAEGNTPLLAGVETAAAMFAGEGERVIVVLSDGYHNCPWGAALDPVIAAVDLASARVYTLGYGRPSDIDHPLLADLAGQLDGVFYNVTGATDEGPVLDAAYKEVLTNALGLDQAYDPIETIAAGETDSIELKLSEYDRRVSFYLSWETQQAGRLGITVSSSDGELVPLGNDAVSLSEGKTYKILTVGLPFLQLPGKVGPDPWLIEISADSLVSEESETYLHGVNLNSGLKLRVSLDRDSYVTGDIITFTARVSTPAGPVRGLEEVYVELMAPEDGAGNWFAENTVSPAELSQIPDTLTNESLSPVLRKALFLSDVRKVPFPGDLGPARIALFDDGTHGDLEAGDGEHTNRFVVRKEGTYSFQFRAVGITQRGNGFQRERKIERYVQVGVTPEEAIIDVVQIDHGEADARRFNIVLTLRDPFDNFLGPRYSRDIHFSSSHGHLVGDVQDNLDGSYTQTLRLPPDVNPDDVDINVNARGVRISFNLGQQLETRFELDGALGATVPTGSFNNSLDSGYRIQMSLGYRFARPLSAVAYFSYNWFRSGATGVSDTHVWSYNANLRVSGTGSVQPFVEGGPGIYVPKGSSAEPGFNVDAGVEFDIARSWGLQLSGGYHRYLAAGTDGEFAVFQAGVVYRR